MADTAPDPILQPDVVLSQTTELDSFVNDIKQATNTRIPFGFSSKRRLAQAATGIDYPVIKMGVNPQTIKWAQAKRIARRETMEGVVYFHFNNRMGQDNDVAILDFSGVTGNINIGNRSHTSEATSASRFDSAQYHLESRERLLVWHNLYNLTREPVLYDDDTDPDLKIENEFYIIYKSPLMQVPIKLTGIYSRVLEFTEEAHSPNMVKYSFQFVVQDTTPDLDAIAASIKYVPVGR